MKNNKYLVLIFSDRNGKPSKEFRPTGYGGMGHNKWGYLQPLTKIAELLNRKAVFTPPWISLCQKHNLNKQINKNHVWGTYLNVSKIKNLESNPSFSFDNNGNIITNLSIKYYPSNTNLNKMDNQVDIIALVNYNDNVTGLKIAQFLKIHKKLNALEKIKLKKFSFTDYPTSKLLKNYAHRIISVLKLKEFTFIHIRRGDILGYKQCRQHTSPEFISNFLRKKVINKQIFIATNERDYGYKKKIIELLDGFTIIFEEEFLKYLPYCISNDNYCIYLILHEIAKKAKINIGTWHPSRYTRLGDKYHYKL